MGGIYDQENTVHLTAEEHFLAHQLLTKIYPGNRKLIFALRAMTFASKRHVRNNKEFGWIRRLANQARTGRKNTAETKRKMSESAKRRWENTAYEDMGAVTNPKSTVTKQRMSEAAKERWRKTDSDKRKAHGDAIRKGHQLKQVQG